MSDSDDLRVIMMETCGKAMRLGNNVDVKRRERKIKKLICE